MNKGKISVIIPVYNAEKYLDKCVNSIIHQTYKNLEIILINDGSTDKSKSLCERYVKNDKRIKLINQRNAGVSRARKTGIDLSTGEYITFVDSDDYIDKEMYEIMLKHIELNHCDIIECGYMFVDRNYHLINKKHVKFEVLNGKSVCLKEYLKGDNGETFLWNKIYKKTLFDNLKLNEYSFSEDYLWNVNLFSKCECKCTIDKNLYYYMKNYEGACNSNNNVKKIEGIYAALDGKRFLDDNGFDCSNYCLKYALQYCLFIYKQFYYSNMDKKYLDKIYKLYKSNYKLSEIKEILSFTNIVALIIFRLSPKMYLRFDKIYNFIFKGKNHSRGNSYEKK